MPRMNQMVSLHTSCFMCVVSCTNSGELAKIMRCRDSPIAELFFFPIPITLSNCTNWPCGSSTRYHVNFETQSNSCCSTGANLVKPTRTKMATAGRGHNKYAIYIYMNDIVVKTPCLILGKFTYHLPSPFVVQTGFQLGKSSWWRLDLKRDIRIHLVAPMPCCVGSKIK